MNPLRKPQVLQFTAKNIVRRNLFNVGVHVETEEVGISNVLFCFKTTISSFDLISYILAFTCVKCNSLR